MTLTNRRVMLLALAAVSLSGCNILKFPLYLVMPDMDKREIPAEFTFPEGSTVAVAVYANLDVMFEYPFIREELASAMAGEFKRHIPDVRLVPFEQVTRYQDSNVYWYSQPMSKLGREVGADYVIYISINEFTTYEHGSISLPRGMMSASACVVKVAAESEDPGTVASERPSWQRTVITIDQDASTGPLFSDQTRLRQVVELKFAIKLSRAFYAYEPDDLEL